MDNNNLGVRKKFSGIQIGLIIALVVAVLFVVLFIVQIIQNNSLKDELSRAKTEIAKYEAQNAEVEKKTLKATGTKRTIEIEEKGVATTDSGTASVEESKKYLEPKGWDVKFEYPEGVTDIAYGINDDNYDGSLYITGIAVGGKIYDVNICGGKDAYEQYPFFLGEVNRWNPSGAHDEWETSPAVYDGMKRFLKTTSFEYYVNTNYGNGCELGDDTEDYVAATKIAKEILESIKSR